MSALPINVELLGPSSTGTCALMCPWCQLLLQARSSENVQRNIRSGGAGRDGRLLLTIDETAERLGLGRSKTYQLAATGMLPVVHLGRSVRVPVDALECWVRAQITGPGFELGLNDRVNPPFSRRRQG